MKNGKRIKRQQFQINDDDTGYGIFTCSNCNMTVKGAYFNGIEICHDIKFGNYEIVDENCKICLECKEIL